MTKLAKVPVGVVVTLILVIVTTRAQGPQVPPTPGGRKSAAQAFKNVQVLKDIPAEQLIPTMQFISASLGVECDFCHAEHDMDKDDKQTKKTAREMMKMTMAINHDSFKGEREVTCNTCHRGSSQPQAIPAIASESAKVGTASDQLSDESELAKWPSGKGVMAKFVEAAGGEAALKQVATRVEKGNALMAGGHQLPIEIFTKPPDQRVSVMHVANGESVTAFNGHEGWLTAPGRPTREMSAPDLYAAKLDAVAFFPVNLAGMFEELKLQPRAEDVGGHAATVVWGYAKEQPPVKLYFDPQTGLLVRMLRYTNTALGMNPTQIDFADYRAVGNVKTPYRWTIARPSGAFTVQLDEVKDNAPIDAARFEKPAAAAQPGTSGAKPGPF
jgi:hypothetical protein